MEHYGALVGWRHTDLGDKLLVCVETVRTLDEAEKHTPDLFRVLLTRNQAAVLGTYLMRVSGHTPPGRAGRFRRRFG